MDSVQRSDISNGIWLCSNCSDLIDKDPGAYDVLLLKKWKSDAEYEMYKLIKGKDKATDRYGNSPFLEVDLRYNSSGRWNEGYSHKNPTEIGENGEVVMFIGFDRDPIIYWKLDWEYSLFIYNNSSFPAFNIKVEQITDAKFNAVSALPKINNLEQMGKIGLTANYIERMEGDHKKADEILKFRVPVSLNGLKLRVSYLDEQKIEHTTIVTIHDQNVLSQKE